MVGVVRFVDEGGVMVVDAVEVGVGAVVDGGSSPQADSTNRIRTDPNSRRAALGQPAHPPIRRLKVPVRAVLRPFLAPEGNKPLGRRRS